MDQISRNLSGGFCQIRRLWFQDHCSGGLGAELPFRWSSVAHGWFGCPVAPGGSLSHAGTWADEPDNGDPTPDIG